MLKILRVVAIALVILGAFFRIQHWPWTEVIFIAAWSFALIPMLWRPLSGQPLLHSQAARDVFTFGLVSLIVLSMLHLPSKGIALGALVFGALGLLWYERDRILPGHGAGNTKPWLFYTALALVLVGTLFRIQHWPYSTVMLMGGLALVAIWFFSTGKDDHKRP